jgi:hypothetical protein
MNLLKKDEINPDGSDQVLYLQFISENKHSTPKLPPKKLKKLSTPKCIHWIKKETTKDHMTLMMMSMNTMVEEMKNNTEIMMNTTKMMTQMTAHILEKSKQDHINKKRRCM